MGEKVLMKGNEAMAEAAILAGCRHYFGYPITPQTEVVETESPREGDACVWEGASAGAAQGHWGRGIPEDPAALQEPAQLRFRPQAGGIFRGAPDLGESRGSGGRGSPQESGSRGGGGPCGLPSPALATVSMRWRRGKS